MSFGTILDSCFKLKFLFFCYTKFDKSTSKNNIGDVNKKFEKLYEEYVINFNDQSVSQSQSYGDSSMLGKWRRKKKDVKIIQGTFLIA